MIFSAKTEYGLVALLELAAAQPAGGVLQVAEIAQRQGIPDRYLEQMLTSLRRARILRSIRGPRGGYQLARPAAEIRVAEVVHCLEGDPTPGSGGSRSTPEFQVLEALTARLEEARSQILAGTTLQELLEQRDQLSQSLTMYFI
jgi:Rrf2 family protein